MIMFAQEEKAKNSTVSTKQVARTWDVCWQDNFEQTKHKFLKKPFYRKFFKQDSLSFIIFDVLRNELVDFKGKYMLEAGSGTGLLSLKCAGEGANVTMVDVSKSALDLSALFFKAEGKYGNFINADIFNLPIKDKTYDVVWNVGVIEHFFFTEQIAILREMARICKKGGLIITINPASHKSLYTFCKKFAERSGQWVLGYEEPVNSLSQHVRSISEATMVKEYRVGFLYQVKFLHYLFYKIRIIQKLVSKTTEFLNIIFNIVNRLPGCFLVTVIKK